MRKLFDQFEELSVKAQELLEKGIGQMRDGFAPDPNLCRDITSSTSSIRKQLRRYQCRMQKIPDRPQRRRHQQHLLLLQLSRTVR